MVILFAQNREQQVRTLDDQVASRATPRLRRTSSYFVLEAKSSTHWLSKDLTCHTETPSWHEFCRRQRGFSCSTGCWCFDLGIYAGNTGKAKAAHTHTHTPFPSQEKQPEVLQQRRSRSRDVNGFNGYRSLGGWWCLNMFGHQMTAGLRWKLPNDFAGGSFLLCSACCNSLSDHGSIVWIGMSRREKGWTRDS